MYRHGFRLLAVSSVAVALFALTAISSYVNARGVANRLFGPLPAGTYQFHNGLIPFARHPNGKIGWVISYGPVTGDAHAEIYVSPMGTVVGTNPLALHERLTLSAVRPAT